MEYIKHAMIATWKMSLDGMHQAYEDLFVKDDRKAALLTAITDVENNPDYHYVGYGGFPNACGIVETDASYMDGNTMQFGAVAGLRDIASPIAVAMELSGKKKDCFLCGEGAKQYAVEHGFESKEMLSNYACQQYKQHRKSIMEHDTVCMIAKDSVGLSCGVSTSGLPFKHPGRVGDSPVIGSGFYCDSLVGSAAATGNGEDVMRGCLSFSVVSFIKAGMDVQKACETALFEHLDRLKTAGYKAGDISLIAMDRYGRCGVATDMKQFPFVMMDDKHPDASVYVCRNENGTMHIQKADEQWLSSWQGD